MKVFHVQEDSITITDSKHKWGNIFGHWDRVTFESLFSYSFPEAIGYLHIEPERDIFISGTDDSDMAPLDEESTHVVWVLANWEFMIRIAAEAQYGEDYSYNETEDAFEITETQQLVIDKRKRQADRLQILSEALKDEFKMILELFEVGKSKGIWTNSDFPQAMRDKAVLWKQTIDDYEAEE